MDPSRACKIILACVVLFNLSKDLADEEDDHDTTEEAEDNVEEGANNNNENNGYTVRDTLVNNFFR